MSMYDKNHYNNKKEKKFFSFPFKIDFVNIFLIMTVWSYALGNGIEPHSMLINSHKNPAGLTLLSQCRAWPSKLRSIMGERRLRTPSYTPGPHVQ